jgi:predicted dehydrogenase
MRNSDTIWVPTKMLSWAGQSGPEWFLLSHAYDMLRYILGQEAHEVYATGTKRVLKGMGIDAYDAIQALVKFDSCFVTFETCWIIPDGWPSIVEVGLTLYGSKGRINFAAGNQGFDLSTSERFNHGRSGRRPGQKLHSSVTTFIDSVLDDTPLLATGEDGLAATAIIEATLPSIDGGSPVKIDYAV